MSGRGGIYEGPDGSKLHGDGREVKAMSQTDRERVIAELSKRYEDVNEYRWDNLISDLYDAGAKAGYIAAKEDAAKTAENMPGATSDEELWIPIRERVAAAIRKLEPKP